MVQYEAFLVSNQLKSFTTNKNELVEYHELAFLIEDEDKGTKVLTLRPKSPDIKDLKVIFKDALKGKFPYGKLTIDYQERVFADRYDPDKNVKGFQPKYVSFLV